MAFEIGNDHRFTLRQTSVPFISKTRQFFRVLDINARNRQVGCLHASLRPFHHNSHRARCGMGRHPRLTLQLNARVRFVFASLVISAISSVCRNSGLQTDNGFPGTDPRKTLHRLDLGSKSCPDCPKSTGRENEPPTQFRKVPEVFNSVVKSRGARRAAAHGQRAELLTIPPVACDSYNRSSKPSYSIAPGLRGWRRSLETSSPCASAMEY
jgi:hypothetical protein